MKSRAWTLLLPLLLASCADIRIGKGAARADEELYSVTVYGRWGYIDRDGKTVIAARFERAGDFCEGLVPVRVGMKWGYVDKAGKIAISPRFDYASGFHGGRAAVMIGGRAPYAGGENDGTSPWEWGGKWGVIDRSGAFVLEPKYDAILDYSDGRARVVVTDDCLCGFIDENGREVVGPKLSDARDFSHGLAPVAVVEVGGNGEEVLRWGYIGTDGRFVIQPRFEEAGTFDGTVAPVLSEAGFVYIDKKGRPVIKTGFRDGMGFQEGLAAVISGGWCGSGYSGAKWGFINLQGDNVVAPMYDWTRGFHDERALVQLGDFLGYLDREGWLVVPLKYDDAGDFSEKLAAVREHERWGYIDRFGDYVIDATYADAGPFRDGLARVRAPDRAGFMDRKGNLVIPPRYEDVQDFREGLAGVKFDGKWGFIERSGKAVIAPRFDEVYPFKEGVAWGRIGGGRNENVFEPVSPDAINGYLDAHWYRIERDGKITSSVVPPERGHFGIDWSSVDSKPPVGIHPFFETEETDGRRTDRWGYREGDPSRVVIAPKYEYARDFAEGLAAVQLDGKWGYIDKTGATVVAARFEDTYGFSEGLAEVQLDGRWGYIDRSGAMVIPPRFDYATPFDDDGLAYVAIEEKGGYIDRKGRWVWNPLKR